MQHSLYQTEQPTQFGVFRQYGMDSVVIAMNPNAGAASAQARVEALAHLLRSGGFDVAVHTDLKSAVDNARLWHDAGTLRALVSAGGDGTAAALTNRTPPGLPLALLPTGTENLLARYLKVDGSPEQAYRMIVAGQRRQMDVGNASGRLFLLMASCGFDAEAVRRAHAARRGHIHRLNWVKAILSAIRNYPFPPIHVYWEREDVQTGTRSSCQTTCRWVFAFNLPCYARGLPLAPQADGSDGLLDLCLFHRGSFWHGLRYAAAVCQGRHQTLPDCTVARCTRLRITADEPVPYQLDGDAAGQLPLEIEVMPRRLTILVPPGNETMSDER